MKKGKTKRRKAEIEQTAMSGADLFLWAQLE